MGGGKTMRRTDIIQGATSIPNYREWRMARRPLESLTPNSEGRVFVFALLKAVTYPNGEVIAADGVYPGRPIPNDGKPPGLNNPVEHLVHVL
eukprot:scaffold139618_cov37-Prasinocladus_malaysianus.AAC.1